MHPLGIIHDHLSKITPITCTVHSTQNELNICVGNLFLTAARGVAIVVTVGCIVVFFRAIRALVALFTTLVALALEWSCACLVRAACLLIVVFPTLFVWAVAGRVALLLAMKARALELYVPEGHFVAVCLVAAQSILFEFSRLRHTKLLKPDLHRVLQLLVTAFD